MDLIINLFHRGGLFMFPLTAAFATGLFAAACQFRLADRTRFPGLDTSISTFLVAIGMAGTAQGLMMVLSVLPMVEDSTRATLMFAGLSTASFTALVGIILAGILVPIQAWARSRVDRSVAETVQPAPVTTVLSAASLALALVSAGALTHFGIFVLEGSAHISVDEVASMLGQGAGAVKLALVAGLGASLLSLLNGAAGWINGYRGYRAGV